jgi:hypothetical protein
MFYAKNNRDIQIIEVQYIGMRIACANDLSFLLWCRWWLLSLVALTVR